MRLKIANQHTCGLCGEIEMPETCDACFDAFLENMITSIDEEVINNEPIPER